MCDCLSALAASLLGGNAESDNSLAHDAANRRSGKYAHVQQGKCKHGVESSPLLSSRSRRPSQSQDAERSALSFLGRSEGDASLWNGHDTRRINGLTEPTKMIEDQINQYRITGKLGKGSWGIVQVAEDVFTKRKVAIKAVGKAGLHVLVC